jgi:hypothetical protein
MMKPEEIVTAILFCHPTFVILSSFVIRHSSINVALCSFRRIGFAGRWRAGIAATAGIYPGATRATHTRS